MKGQILNMWWFDDLKNKFKFNLIRSLVDLINNY